MPVSAQVKRNFPLDGKIVVKTTQIAKKWEVEQVFDEIKKDLPFYKQSGGGVSFSGGEATMQAEALIELAKKCKSENIHTSLDTCGFTDRSKLESIYPWIDLFLFDLKLMDPDQHRKFTGQDNTLILENLEWLITKKAKIIIRIPLIPGITDSDENLQLLKAFFARHPELNEVHLLPYHYLSKHKSEQLEIETRFESEKRYSGDDLSKIQRLINVSGLKIKIGG